MGNFSLAAGDKPGIDALPILKSGNDVRSGCASGRNEEMEALVGQRGVPPFPPHFTTLPTPGGFQQAGVKAVTFLPHFLKGNPKTSACFRNCPTIAPISNFAGSRRRPCILSSFSSSRQHFFQQQIHPAKGYFRQNHDDSRGRKRIFFPFSTVRRPFPQVV